VGGSEAPLRRNVVMLEGKLILRENAEFIGKVEVRRVVWRQFWEIWGKNAFWDL